jgi:hypothetical protein
MFEMAAETKALLDYFLRLDYGDVARYAVILEETGCDVAAGDRSRIYSVVRRLEAQHDRTLVNVRGLGYKVAQPAEHVDVMTIRKGRAGRQIELAQRTGKATSLRHLDTTEAQRLSDAMNHLSRISQAVDFHDRRIERIERHLGIQAEAAVDATAEEVSDEGN